jgi:prolyl 4-hydroxylase
MVETRKGVKKIPPLSRRLTQLFHSSSPDLGRWNKNKEVLCSSPNIFRIRNFLSESEIQYFDQIITRHKRLFKSSYTEEADEEDDVDDNEEEQASEGDDIEDLNANGTVTTNNKNESETAPSSSSMEMNDIPTIPSNDAPTSITPSSTPVAVVNHVKKVYSSERTSTYIHLTKSQDKVVRAIEIKAADILGLDVCNVEPLQIVHYENGQQFTLHHDAGTFNAENGEIVDVIHPRRLVTFFVYLNNLPENEGCTEFPSLNLKVHPIRGSAVLFCNMLPDGNADKRTIHCANPVSYPLEKYGLNIWVCDQNLHDFTYLPVKIKLPSASNKKRLMPTLDKDMSSPLPTSDQRSPVQIATPSTLAKVEEKTSSVKKAKASTVGAAPVNGKISKEITEANDSSCNWYFDVSAAFSSTPI